MKFIDLFAGLGGFHLALRSLGHTCVFASEKDEALQKLYTENFQMDIAGDIRLVNANSIPAHDILCAGFPCQPFSKAGSQEGFGDQESGGVFFDILRIAHHHRPRYMILENVPNFERHDNGKTWERIERLLRAEGYDVNRRTLSPHLFGIPQIRERIYVVAARGSLNGFLWPQNGNLKTSIRTILDIRPRNARQIPDQVKQCLAVWQEFLDNLPVDERVIHPIWSMEFGATYPYEDTTPSRLSTSELRRYRGSHGQPLVGRCKEDVFKLLPSHARRDQETFPSWKVRFIRQNRQFYERHKKWIDRWKPKIMAFPSSLQKLEWNCQGERRDIKTFIVQMRASGVRVKRPTTSPSLVALNTTQVPIITWEERYMTPLECQRLQSMEELGLPLAPARAYEALGNAVNVEVARLVAQALLSTHESSRLTEHIDASRQ